MQSGSWAEQRADDRRETKSIVIAIAIIIIFALATYFAINLVDRAGASINGGCIQTSGWPNGGCTVPTPNGSALAQLVTNYGTQQVQVAWAENWGFACSGAIRWYPALSDLNSYISGTAEFDICHHNPNNPYGISEARTAIVVPNHRLTIYVSVFTSKWGIVVTQVSSVGGIWHCGYIGKTLWCEP